MSRKHSSRILRQSLGVIVFLCFIFLTQCSPSFLSIPQGEQGQQPGGQDLPTASIPLPSLESQLVMFYAEDEDGTIPVVGTNAVNVSDYADANGDGYADGLWVMVSDDNPTMQTATRPEKPIWKNVQTYAKNILIATLPKAWATTLGAELVTEPTLCNEPGHTCIPITMDGNFEGYHEGTNDALLFMSLVDESDNISDPTEEAPNKNFLWLKQTPTDVGYAGPGTVEGTPAEFFAVLGQDRLVQIELINGQGKVLGTHSDNYESASALKASQLAFDNLGKLTLREPVDGISQYNSFFDTGLENFDFLDSGVDTIVTGAHEYVALKYTNEGLLRFGIKQPTPSGQAKIFYALDSTIDSITYLDDDLTDNDDGVTYIEDSETVIYDVDTDEYALVIFKDQFNQFRLRWAREATSKRFGGETALGTNFNFGDLVIYYNSVGKGKALLTDNLNNMVWYLEYNVISGFESITSVLDSSINGIPVDSPHGLTFNDDKTVAYVADSNNNKIYKLDLFNGSTPKTVSEINADKTEIDLTRYLNGKNKIISPTELIYRSIDSSEYLIINSEDSSMVILL